ncbi:EamA family transporter [Paenibacillus allorhizosphaerae]|uniref:EamA domain-containing protein n=1 Tax=Paenibacillus allorhizosphaerae TaxID=2849866 RepID=A0ABN7TQ97_9BACL|nr:EamA family transporter [Paenibacillus allorhizosphaerae]CAG7650954.1 hypothetical protein PAECIP111802_04847 [Paenibacillus allorhizosphaerae]
MWFVFAAAAAVCFGLRGILYQWTSQRPIQRNLLLFGVYFSGMVIAAVAGFAAGQAWTSSVWIGTLMGLFSFVSNAAMYKGFAVGKASLVAMFTALPPVVVAVLAYFLWEEKLNIWQFGAFVVIMGGILMIRYSSDISLRHLQGAGWGVLTMLFFGFTDLSSKASTMLGAPPLPTLVVMYATGTLLFGLSWAMDSARERQARAILRQAVQETAAGAAEPAASVDTQSGVPRSESASGIPGEVAAPRWSVKKTFLWGLFVGISNICGMMLILPAFKLGVTGLVSAVIAMNVIIVLLYARFVLKEKFSRLETGGLMCAIIGILILRLAA